VVRTDVAELLIDIESELRRLNQWSQIPPSAIALASQEPFCIDTLTLPEWLQFVFLPSLYERLEADQPLPDRCNIAPMAEEYFRGSALPADPLVLALKAIDTLLSEQVDADPGGKQ
jgi:uncharacterized protein YqcC (DUF446 family)